MTDTGQTVESRQWLDRSEAAALLDVSTQTLDRYARDRRIRRYRVRGRLTRYRIEDVELLARERETPVGD